MRKEFERTADFELELENLSILKHLKHPNIVELLGSYTYKNMHNLIFLKADFGDLQQLLSSPRPPSLSSNASLVLALANLSSGLSAVHNFSAESIEMHKIGFHHDIKPKNILVTGEQFILADFGLSRFKDSTQASGTPFEMGADYYLAPECEDLDGKFEKHTIHRSSDIWSFGCIVAEFLTYLIRGSKGVENFKEARKFQLGSWTFRHFHCGKDKPNPEVSIWLSKLEQDCSSPSSGLALETFTMLSVLAKSMLSMDPLERPRATETESRLCFIAISMISREVAKLFSHVQSQSRASSVETFIQERKFMAWRYALRIINDSGKPTVSVPSATPLVKNFSETVQSLHEIQGILNDAISSEQFTSRVFLPVQHLITHLVSQLPQSLREDSDAFLELQLLRSENEAQLDNVCDTLKNSPIDKRVGMLATIKKMIMLTNNRTSHGDPEMPVKPILDVRNLGKKVTGHISEKSEKSSGPGQQVLVEWKCYGEHWDKHGEDLLNRVSRISKLHSSIKSPEAFRVLECAGFYHAPEKYAFGLVFKFPQEMPRANIFTLQDMLDTRGRMPYLETRFKLAHLLSASVLQFHKLKWLHRAISSANVVFFASETEPTHETMEIPFLVGFVHSRQDDKLAFTEGPPEGYQDYQHPEYRGYRGSRFRPEFDYYSLGIVLLELGLWQSVAKMTVGEDWKGIEYAKFSERLIDRRVPQLRQLMGSVYRNVTKACLVWKPTEGEPEGSVSNVLKFQKLVVEPLSRCIVG